LRKGPWVAWMPLVLIAAVESGSLSEAVRNLGLPLAKVSRKVSELEAHLNATLLIRSAKGLELTPGRPLLRRQREFWSS
jgi:DNA-binding transcriptional LysR family regulator